jgi:uncharacterized membrane protein
MNKNAYEIRLEVLKMAKEMMDTQYTETSNAYWLQIESVAKIWNKTIEDALEHSKTEKPKMYTPSEIMEKANELYSFINKPGKE